MTSARRSSSGTELPRGTQTASRSPAGMGRTFLACGMRSSSVSRPASRTARLQRRRTWATWRRRRSPRRTDGTSEDGAGQRPTTSTAAGADPAPPRARRERRPRARPGAARGESPTPAAARCGAGPRRSARGRPGGARALPRARRRPSVLRRLGASGGAAGGRRARSGCARNETPERSPIDHGEATRPWTWSIAPWPTCGSPATLTAMISAEPSASATTWTEKSTSPFSSARGRLVSKSSTGSGAVAHMNVIPLVSTGSFMELPSYWYRRVEE